MANSTNFTNTATLIHVMSASDAESIRITNISSGGVIVYLGGASVGTTTGLGLGPGSHVVCSNAPGVSIYGITAGSAIAGTVQWSAVTS